MPKNENDITHTGIYQITRINSTLINGFCGSQAFLLCFNTSINGDDYITQIAISYANIDTPIAIRNRTGESVGAKWGQWRYISQKL